MNVLLARVLRFVTIRTDLINADVAQAIDLLKTVTVAQASFHYTLRFSTKKRTEKHFKQQTSLHTRRVLKGFPSQAYTRVCAAEFYESLMIPKSLMRTVNVQRVNMCRHSGVEYL